VTHIEQCKRLFKTTPIQNEEWVLGFTEQAGCIVIVRGNLRFYGASSSVPVINDSNSETIELQLKPGYK